MESDAFIYSHCLAKLHTRDHASQMVGVTPLVSLPGRFYKCETDDGREITVHVDNLTTMPDIPSRYRKHLFDGVAHIIGAALKAWPDAITVNPSPLSIETYARRLREAVVAKEKYGHKNPEVDEHLFSKHGPQLVASISTGELYFGSPEGVKNKATAVGVNTTKPKVTEHQVNKLFLEEVCLLLHKRVFNPAPTFFVEDLDPATAAELENKFDIAFVPYESAPNRFCIIT